MALELVILVRLVAPLLTFTWPVVGALISILADAFDYSFITTSAVGPHNYQYVDKLLDLYLLAVVTIASRRWLDKVARRTLLLLFCFRLAGELLFFVTHTEWILFFFPNLALDFYLFYVLYRRLTKQDQLIKSKADLASILAVLLVPKLFSEYYLHVYHLVSQPVPQWLRHFYDLSANIQLLFYLAPPLVYLFWYARRARLKINNS